MLRICLSFILLVFSISYSIAQPISLFDDFEGSGTITTWQNDDCVMNTRFPNPQKIGINTSDSVMLYQDIGGQYANVFFDSPHPFNLTVNKTFTLKIFIPSSGLTGNQPNQISLKLQNGFTAAPWSTQSEIIKPVVLDQWQTISFNFLTDNFINIDPSSLPPTQRTDFNRVLIQINGENNNHLVVAYIDDFAYDGTVSGGSPATVFTTLVWSDEFNGNGAIDTSKWFHQTQLPAGGNWFNGEVQHYTNRTDNSVINNGIMSIIAKRENFTDQGVTKQFTSARLNSKFAFTYGRVEVRAKLPTGVGTWPAIWTLGKNINEDGAYWFNQGFGTTNWPACGEIDIMEHWGTNQNMVESAMHTPSSFGNTVNKGGRVVPTASTAFHIYEMIWDEEKIVFSVDGIVHYTYNPPIKNASTWPFTADQYLLLNVAIQPVITAGFTSSAMEIDYVRVYQQGVSSQQIRAKDPKITVFPNPVGDQVTVRFDQEISQPITIQILQLDGRLVNYGVYALENNQVKIHNLSNLKSGVYLISFDVAGKKYHQKMVKM